MPSANAISKKECFLCATQHPPQWKLKFKKTVLFATRNFHAIQMEMVRPTNEFAVICHGDLWLSNILFKYGMPICCTGGGGGCGGSIDALVRTIGDIKQNPP